MEAEKYIRVSVLNLIADALRVGLLGVCVPWKNPPKLKNRVAIAVALPPSDRRIDW